MEYILYLHRVFHGIKFKVNRRLVVGMTTIFFISTFQFAKIKKLVL